MDWLRQIALSLLVLLVTACAVPIVSERELEVQSDQEFEKMRTQMVESRDARTISYVRCVSDAIIAEIQEPYASLDWEVVVFESKDINAFALPGGNIGVFTGLLEITENQDQLAAVIGHEVAHVTEKHSVERMNQAYTAQAGVFVAGALGGGTAADAASILGEYGLLRPYGRRQESEADIVGLRYMASAGFDPRASVELWKNMEKNAGGGPPEFLSTHPSSSTRIQDLIKQYSSALAVRQEALAAGKRPDCKK